MTLPLHIATASDAGYFPALEVLVGSTLLHVPAETETHFHIFDGGIPADGWELLRRHAARFHPRAFIHPLPFSEERFSGFRTLHGNKLTYARLLLADCLPDLDKILYIDSDIIVGRNLAELRDTPMQGRTALAAADFVVTSLDQDCPWLAPAEAAPYPYFNAGVLVLDLARWRKRGYFAECAAAISAEAEKCRYWDQTALNYVLRDDVTFLPSIWNQVAFSSAAVPDAPINLHLIGDKPWRNPFPRFDHYVWMACYADLIGPQNWTRKLSVPRKLFFLLPRYRSTRWIFWLGFSAILAATRHRGARARRAQTLFWAMSDFTVLKRLQAKWRERLAQRTRASSMRSSGLSAPNPAPAKA